MGVSVRSPMMHTHEANYRAVASNVQGAKRGLYTRTVKLRSVIIPHNARYAFIIHKHGEKCNTKNGGLFYLFVRKLMLFYVFSSRYD